LESICFWWFLTNIYFYLIRIWRTVFLIRSLTSKSLFLVWMSCPARKSLIKIFVNRVNPNSMSLASLFQYLMLNMFRMLVHPSLGGCNLFVELFHGLYCSGSMCVGVTVWFCWGGVVYLYSTIKVTLFPVLTLTNPVCEIPSCLIVE